MSSNSAHNDLLVGAAFVGGFALAAYLVSRTGSGRSASSGAAGGAAAASLCGPILNPTFDGPIGVPLPEDGSSKWICRCGQSKKFPFCDGTHNAYNKQHGTKFTPFEANRVTMPEGDTIWVCQCGLSKTRNEQGIPVCDGSHSAGKPK